MRTLRVGVLTWPGSGWCEECIRNSTTLQGGAECPTPGYNNEILADFFRENCLMYEMIQIYDQSDWGSRDKNGTWHGVLGDLKQGSYDLLNCGYYYSEEKDKEFLFSYPLQYARPALFFRKQYPQMDPTSLVTVFSPWLWACVIALCIALSIVISLNNSAFHPHGHWWAHIKESCWTCLTFVTDQCDAVCNESWKKTITYKMSLALLGLLSLFVINLYQGGLLGALVQERTLNVVTGSLDLAAQLLSGEKQLVVENGDAFAGLINTSNETVYQQLRAGVAVTPTINLISEGPKEMAIFTAKSDRFVSHITENAARRYMQTICDSDYIVDGDRASQRVVFAFRQGDDFLEQIADKLNQFLSNHAYLTSIIQKYNKVPIEKLGHCAPPKPPISPISYKNVSGFFMVFLVFLALSICIFFFELILYRRRNRLSVSMKEMVCENSNLEVVEANISNGFPSLRHHINIRF